MTFNIIEAWPRRGGSATKRAICVVALAALAAGCSSQASDRPVPSSGPVAYNSPAGFVGPTGYTGPAGPTGVQGPTGPVGATGYGATGPKKHYIAYGPVQVAMTGLSSVSGYPGRGPSEIGIAYGDPNAGIHAALAVLAALRHRRRTGEGQYVDMSQWEAAIGLGAEALMDVAMNGTQPSVQGNRDRLEAPQGVFRCAGEDEWVAIACWTDAQWRALAAAIGRSDLERDARFQSAAGRKRDEELLEIAIAGWTATRAPDEIVAILQAKGVPSYRPLSNRGLAEDEQLNAWGAFVDLEHPEAGERRHVGAPWRFSESEVGAKRPAPLLYADTDRVLSEVLGYDEREIRRLREGGAIA